MSYSDYLAGLRDGFSTGFNAGYRKGVDDTKSVGYLAGYKDGYGDAAGGLPYQPQERLRQFSLSLPDPPPLSKFEPLPVPNYTPSSIDFGLKNEPPLYNPPPPLNLNINNEPPLYNPSPPLNFDIKIDPPTYVPPTPLDLNTKNNLLSDIQPPKKPWEI